MSVSGPTCNGRRKKCVECGRWCYWKRIIDGKFYRCFACHERLTGEKS